MVCHEFKEAKQPDLFDKTMPMSFWQNKTKASWLIGLVPAYHCAGTCTKMESKTCVHVSWIQVVPGGCRLERWDACSQNNQKTPAVNLSWQALLWMQQGCDNDVHITSLHIIICIIALLTVAFEDLLLLQCKCRVTTECLEFQIPEQVFYLLQCAIQAVLDSAASWTLCYGHCAWRRLTWTTTAKASWALCPIRVAWTVTVSL